MSRIESIWDNVLVEASALPIVEGVPLIALDSGDMTNNTGTLYNSIRVTLEYAELTPDPGGSPPFQLGASVEMKDEVTGLYMPIAYQFNFYNRSSSAPKRIMVLQPSMDTFNLGIDDVIFPLNREEARISREQGVLRNGLFRVCIRLIDNNLTHADKFVSVRVSGEAELYNV